MLRKVLFYIFVLFISVAFHGQELLPNVVPVSPEAASLGKYGDLPVNLASGRINYSIPIFTIKEGDFELPIYLSYNHSGLLAEEDPGLVGLGWTLHAGGMVVRQLRGKPDEGSLGYVASNIGKDCVIPFNFNLWANLPINEREEKKFNLLNGAYTERLDTQPDKFVINAGSLSGNFSYNELGEAIFFPHKKYKVTQSNGFVITDDKGVIYTFSAKEETLLETITNNELANHPMMSYTSGWGLTKIEFPTSNNSINIEYGIGADYYKEGFSESKSVLTTWSGISQKCSSINSLVDISQINTGVSSKQISKISFSQGSVHFDIREVTNDSDSNVRSKNYLHSITVKNKANQIINYYEFVFDNLSSNFKLLKEIKKYGNDSISQIPFYKFEYNGTPPLSIFYANQDSWGYYNGKSNTNLMSGDRSVIFSKSSIGSLTKIIYPTKGFTQINYEPNKVPLLDNSFLAAGQCYTTPINSTKGMLANSRITPNPDDITIFIKTDQVIKVTFHTSVGGQGIAEAYASITAQPETGFNCNVFDPCNYYNGGCSTSESSAIEQGIYLNPNSQRTSYFEVKANTLLTLEAFASATYAFGSARIDVNYFDPDLITPENNYVEVGGIRVSSTLECSSPENCISKNYKYILEDGVSSGVILSEPSYSNEYRIDDHTVNSPGNCIVKQYFSNSKVPLASFQGAPVLYKRVEILSNNNDIIGKTVQYFTSQRNINNPAFPLKDTKDWKNGNLIKQEIFQKNGNQLSLIEKTENTYKVYNPYPTGLEYRKHSIGLLSRKTLFSYDINGVEVPMLSTDGYREFSYNNKPEFYHLISTTTTDYLNESQLYKTITYLYDDLTGYPKEEVIVDSRGSNIKSINTYPTNGRLFDENRISTPIKVENFKDNTKLSSQETIFTDFNENYLPHKIQTSKGSGSIEDRVVYHNYDNKGNLLEVSKKDGISITYIWGYNQTQPIAKIEGVAYVNLPTTYLNAAISASNTGTESELVNALNILRTQIPNAMVSTFTYKPLIGVSTVTDPKGDTQYYHYDSFNRLQYVKDKNGNILSENQYHYRD